MEHWDEAAFMSASEISRAVGLSESVVVRFATDLGYRGFPDLKRDLEYLVKKRLTKIDLLNSMAREHDSGNLDRFQQFALDAIKRTAAANPASRLRQVAQWLADSGTVYVVGMGMTQVLVDALAMHLAQVAKKVVACTNPWSWLYHLNSVAQDDVIIGLSFARYRRDTVNALRYVQELDNPPRVILITDSFVAPATQWADEILIAETGSLYLSRSHVSATFLIESLLLTYWEMNKDVAARAFSKLEGVYEEQHIFVLDDKRLAEPDVDRS